MIWLPIETAPKRGVEVLLYGLGNRGRANAFQGRWIDKTEGMPTDFTAGWYWLGYNREIGPVRPTHWMPLPTPPEAP